jgi:hypothetical protein
MLPPEVPRNAVFPSHIVPDPVECGDNEAEDADDETQMAGWWLSKVLPTLDLAALGGYEFIQNAGEILFIPSQWWHVAVSVDGITVGVTQVHIAPSQQPPVFYYY